MLGLDSPINILIETWLTMVESSCQQSKPTSKIWTFFWHHPPTSSNCTPMNSEMRLTFRRGNKHPIHSPEGHMNGPAQSRAFFHHIFKTGCHVLPQTTAQVRERSDILEFAKWMRQKKCHSLKNQRECGMSHWTNCQPPDFEKIQWLSDWSGSSQKKTTSCYTAILLMEWPLLDMPYTYTPWFTGYDTFPMACAQVFIEKWLKKRNHHIVSSLLQHVLSIFILLKSTYHLNLTSSTGI